MDVATNASKIFDLLIQYLCVEHIDYAIELGLQGQYHVSVENCTLNNAITITRHQYGSIAVCHTQL